MYPLPDLHLTKGEVRVLSVENDDFYELGLSPEFLTKVIEAKEALQKEGILKKSFLSIIAVNPAASVLHYACAQQKYKAILKPSLLKEKSEKESICAPFINNFCGRKLKTRNAKYANDEFLKGIMLRNIPLRYPLAHFKKLVDLRYVEILSGSDSTGVLRVKSREENYSVRFCDKSAKELDLRNYQSSDFISSHGSKLVEILKKEGRPKYILGIQLHPGADFYPIISDIDAHNIGIQGECLGEELAFFRTSSLQELAELKKSVEGLLANKRVAAPYTSSLHPYCGRMAAEEAILAYDVNRKWHTETKKTSTEVKVNLRVVLQHGATASIGNDENKIRDLASGFPAITDKTRIALIIDKDNVLSLKGIHILLVYKILKEEYGYKLGMLDSWKEQLKSFDELNAENDDSNEKKIFKAQQEIIRSKLNKVLGKYQHNRISNSKSHLFSHSSSSSGPYPAPAIEEQQNSWPSLILK